MGWAMAVYALKSRVCERVRVHYVCAWGQAWACGACTCMCMCVCVRVRVCHSPVERATLGHPSCLIWDVLRPPVLHVKSPK